MPRNDRWTPRPGDHISVGMSAISGNRIEVSMHSLTDRFELDDNHVLEWSSSAREWRGIIRFHFAGDPATSYRETLAFDPADNEWNLSYDVFDNAEGAWFWISRATLRPPGG